ncbi:MAG: YraN family protein [bacterium]|nr:YraN family protein [bacterium]
MTAKSKDDKRKELGRRGEEAAAVYLIENGYEIIHRNWRCSRGEIDIITRKGDCYVFVEVKTAGKRTSADPREYLTMAKLKRMHSAMMWYLTEEAPEIDPYYRMDFLALTENSEGLSVQHFKAVDPEQY